MATFAITIASGKVASNLTDFPVMVRLSDMPSGFWSTVTRSGGDIRAKASDGTTLLPIDVGWFSYDEQDGVVFFKAPSVLAASSNTFYLTVDGSSSALSPSDSHGRNNVWSDYHRVFLLAAGDGGFVDRCGSGTFWVPTANTTNGNVSLFGQATSSGDVLSHQGITWDGTYYYTFDTNAIRKWTSAWSLVATNSNPVGDVKTATGDTNPNHCGDGCVVGGVIYAPVSKWDDPTVTGSHQYIAKYSASTLAFIAAVDVSAGNPGQASICYVPDDSTFYVAGYGASTATLWKFDGTTLAASGTVTLSAAVTYCNGITWWRNKFWMSGQDADATSGFKFIVSVDHDGTVGSRVVQYVKTGWNEGIDHKNDRLLLTFSTADSQGNVYELTPYGVVGGAGMRLHDSALWNSTNVGGGKATGLTRYTTWTIGLSVTLASKPAASANIASYTENAATDDTLRATLAWHQATDRLGIWNNADSWLDGLASPTLNAVYRMHDVHEGTTRRTYYENGVSKGVDNTITAMPASTATALYLGFDDASAAGPLTGNVAFVYLRPSALSADWIAAEYSNLNAPGSFYGVTASAGPQRMRRPRTLHGTRTGTRQIPFGA